MTIPNQKPQAFSHMMWFFILPCLGFVAWSGFKLFRSGIQKPATFTLQERVSKIRNAHSPGDRWQAAYGLSQDIQQIIRGPGGMTSLSKEKQEILFSEMEDLLRAHKTDVRLKKYLLLTLSQMGNLRSVPVFEEFVADGDSEIRFFSAWGLVELLTKNPGVASEKDIALIESLTSNEDPALRKISASFLVQQKYKESSLNRVRAQLMDSDIEVKWNAAVALATVKDKSGEVLVAEFFDLKAIRSANSRTLRDLTNLVATAHLAAKKLASPLVFEKVDALKASVSSKTPEGRAILAGLR